LACTVVRREALFVEEVSYTLAKLDARRRVAVLHGYTPQDGCEVEFDLEVSVVWHRKAAEYSRIASTVYVTGAASLLGCG
jgi:hypothetical protein